MRYKKTTARLKNPSHFQSYKDKDRFEEFLEPIKILQEKGFIFPHTTHGCNEQHPYYRSKAGMAKILFSPSKPSCPSCKEVLSQHAIVRSTHNFCEHLEPQKHQFALYIKRKYADFPDLLLQQFKFREAEAAIAVEGSEDAAVGKERE